MTLTETLITLAAGSGLTLISGYIQHRLQSAKSDAESARNFHRNWHGETVELAAETESLYYDLALIVRDARFTSASSGVEGIINNVWIGGSRVRHRIIKMFRGHPDAMVRQAFFEVYTGLSALLVLVLNIHALTMEGENVDERLAPDDRRALAEVSWQAFGELRRCLHGPDVEVFPFEPSRALKFMRERFPDLAAGNDSG